MSKQQKKKIKVKLYDRLIQTNFYAIAKNGNEIKIHGNELGMKEEIDYALLYPKRKYAEHDFKGYNKDKYKIINVKVFIREEHKK